MTTTTVKKRKPYDTSKSESQTLGAITAICRYIEAHEGDLPSIHSEDPGVRKLGHKLHNLRYARTGKNDVVFKKVYDDTASALGFPWLLHATTAEDRRKKQLRDAKSIVNVYLRKGSTPSHSNPDPTDRKLGEKLHNMRGIAKGRVTGVLYDSTVEYLKSVGMDWILEGKQK